MEPIYASPPEPPRQKWLEILLGIVGVTVFVVVPATWIIVVMLRHFGVLPK